MELSVRAARFTAMAFVVFTIATTGLEVTVQELIKTDERAARTHHVRGEARSSEMRPGGIIDWKWFSNQFSNGSLSAGGPKPKHVGIEDEGGKTAKD